MDEQTITQTGMRLANRAYLYGVFHIVFGADVSKEELLILSGAETTEAIELLLSIERNDAEGKDEYDGEREEAATTQRPEEAILPVESFARLLKTVKEIGESANSNDYVEMLRSAYSRLFVAPGKSYVHLWESPYRGKSMMLFQESTQDVKRSYREFGFTPVQEGNFPEDHLAMMLDFMSQLSVMAFNAFGEEDDTLVKKILQAQAEFIEGHFGEWLYELNTKLREKDNTAVFSQFAETLRAFIETDKVFVKSTLASEAFV